VTIIALLAVAAVLARTIRRRMSLIAALAGVVGAVLCLFEVGTTVVRAPRVLSPLLAFRLDQVVFNPGVRGTAAALLVVGGAILMALAWLVLGYAVYRTLGFSNGDGGLLMIGGPAVFLGGLLLGVLPVVGSFLLFAAGLGMIGSAARVARSGGALTAPVQVPRAPMTSFAPFANPEDRADEAVREQLYAEALAEPVAEPKEPAVPAKPVKAPVADGPLTVPAGTPDPEPAKPAKPSAFARLSRGMSTAWPVTRAKLHRNSRTPAGSDGASVKPVAGGTDVAGASVKTGRPNAGGHAATPASTKSNNAGGSASTKRRHGRDGGTPPAASIKDLPPHHHHHKQQPGAHSASRNVDAPKPVDANTTDVKPADAAASEATKRTAPEVKGGDAGRGSATRPKGKGRRGRDGKQGGSTGPA
jgi:hypothetical protein